MPCIGGGQQGGFERGPFAAERGHEHGLNDGDDVVPAGELRAQRGQLVGVQAAGKEGAHDAGLDVLPIRLGRVREDAALVIVQIEDGGILEKMAVEMANLVSAEHAARGHRAEERFERLGEMVRVVQGRPGQLREELLGQQVGVLGEEAEDEAVEEPGDAEALALGDADFGAGVRVRQFGAFALVQGAGDFGELFRQLLGDLGGGALGLEEFGIPRKRRGACASSPGGQSGRW